jgi:hypothetical protein
MGVGLLVEEHRAEIQQAWIAAVESELPGERALEFAVGPLLRELSLALRADGPRSGPSRPDPLPRCAVLVRSAASPARVAREFKILHRAVWDALRRAGRIVAAEERRAADEWLDEGLAAALERTDRIRMRIDLLEPGARAMPARGPSPATSPATVAKPAQPPVRQRPPPLPWNRPGASRPEPPAQPIE